MGGWGSSQVAKAGYARHEQMEIAQVKLCDDI